MRMMEAELLENHNKQIKINALLSPSEIICGFYSIVQGYDLYFLEISQGNSFFGFKSSYILRSVPRDYIQPCFDEEQSDRRINLRVKFNPPFPKSWDAV